MQISILLQITGGNSLLSMRTLKMIRQRELKIELKNIKISYRSCFKNVNMARFVDLSENELSFLLQEKDAENTKKYLEEKRLSEGELITMFG